MAGLLTTGPVGGESLVSEKLDGWSVVSETLNGWSLTSWSLRAAGLWAASRTAVDSSLGNEFILAFAASFWTVFARRQLALPRLAIWLLDATG